jgi:c-di-GMP-binding flagellar brake protein YcgR
MGPAATSMPQLQTIETSRPRKGDAERRRHHRVRVALLGRYMLADRREYPCQTTDISPGGASITAPVRGQIGERIVVYFEHIGRVEGEITRHLDQGFAISITATIRKRDKIASQLTWLANRQALGLPEDRRHERIIPRQPVTLVRLENGRTFAAQLIDISLSGAALATEQALPIETSLTVGHTPAKVVRQFQGGVAVEFRLPLSPDRFDENIIL